MIKLTRPACPNPVALTTDYKNAGNKEALRVASCGKCMYCESKVDHVYFGDVEHIKPKDSFPELTFVWTNLGFVCAKCNNAKLNFFDAATPFVNPYDEEPDDHFVAAGPLVIEKAGSERGELTKRKLELNRGELVERRLERIETLTKAFAVCARTANADLKAAAMAELMAECDVDKEFSFVAKAFVSLHGVV